MKLSIGKIKSLINRFGYWAFAIIMGIVLIFLENEEDIEPLFSITAFIYWSLLFYWAIKWLFRQIKSTIKQKKEKTQIELLHLQSQVNPHFFFNTLNNLYGLVEKDAKKAQQLILKLSDMMRYSIYEGQRKFVTIEEEIAYLENYIELHKMRYHKKIDVRFIVNIENKKTEIMPLLFIILLENAFKHGVENLRTGAYVTVKLNATMNAINFEVENNFDSNEVTKDDGIGLKNLKRRLELVYPKKHHLSFSVTDKTIYNARLTLQNNG